MRVLAGWLVMLVALAAFAQDDYSAREARAVAYAKQISVAKLDPHLKPEPLGTWLQRTFANAQIAYELNDCGEGGDRDPRGVPTCVEAKLHLDHDRDVFLSVAIGDSQHLIQGQPSIFYIVAKEAGSYRSVLRLSDLTRLARRSAR